MIQLRTNSQFVHHVNVRIIRFVVLKMIDGAIMGLERLTWEVSVKPNVNISCRF